MEETQDNANVELFIKALTIPYGLYMANSSIKLLFPCHPLHAQFKDIFSGPLASFWGLPGYGWALRWLVGLGKLGFGVGVVLSEWHEAGYLVLAISLVGLALIMAGAIATNFAKGWAAMRLPSALFTCALVLLYLHCIRGGLVGHGLAVVGVLLGAKVLLGLALWNKRRTDRSVADLKADFGRAAGSRVEVLAGGSAAGSKSDGVYYRLV